MAASPSIPATTAIEIRISVAGNTVASGTLPPLAVLRASVPLGQVSVTADGTTVLTEPRLIRRSSGDEVTYFGQTGCAEDPSL